MQTPRQRASPPKPIPLPKKPKKNTKPTKGKAKQPLFSEADRYKISNIDGNQLKAYVTSKVTHEMFGECFPERTILWEQLIESKKLSDVINSASEEYLKLYSANCASAKDKDSVRLNVFQSLTGW